jgi:hypothetical protein
MTQSPGAGFTAKVATEVHGRDPRRLRRTCNHCHRSFTAARATAKYCSDACRGKAYRARQQPQTRIQPAPKRAVSICQHCGNTFRANIGKRQIYCSESCKTLAYRARRAALIYTIAAYTGTTSDIAADSVEKHGMKRATTIMQALGLIYDAATKSWVQSGRGANVVRN